MWRVFSRDERGVAAVEAGIIMPIFIAIMLAAVDFGSVFYVQHVMNTVANDVSRSLAMGHFSTAQAETIAQSRLPAWNAASFTVTASDVGANNIQIVISVPTQQAALVNFAPLGIWGTLTVTAVKRKV